MPDTRPFRGVILWAAVAVVLSVTVAVLALIISIKVVGDAQTENSALKQQVDTNARRSECRSRITAAAEVTGNDRATAQSRYVLATARLQAAQNTGNTEEASNQRVLALQAVADIERLNTKLEAATDLQAHQVDICTNNPGFLPPPVDP